MSIAVVGQREWEGGLMLGEMCAKERKILADLASPCHGKEARGQQGCEHLAHRAKSGRLLGWDGGAGGGRGAIG